MDVTLTPKVEKKVHAKPGDKTASGKWMEQSLQVSEKTPHNKIIDGLWKRAWNSHISEQLMEDLPTFTMFTTTLMRIPKKDIRLCKIRL